MHMEIYIFSISHSGAFYDTTGNHYVGFFFAGTLVLISGLLFVILSWVKHDQGREDEKIPLLKEDTPTSEFVVQSSLAWPLSLPPFEEFTFMSRNEGGPKRLSYTPSECFSQPVRCRTMSTRW